MTRMWSQIFLVALIPAAFLLLAAFAYRAPATRPAVKRPWTLALLTAAVWSSAIISHYVAAAGAAPAVPYTWQVIGAHALALIPFWLLWTTLNYVTVAPATRRVALGLAATLWLAALALNPSIWRYDIAAVSLLGRSLRFFDIWGGVWVAAWFMPLAIAWDLSRHAFFRLPASLYRNQLHYWWLALSFFLAGGVLAFARQPDQVPLQEVAAYFMLVAAVTGSIALSRNQAPELQRQLRQVARQLSSALVLFGLVGLLLWFIRHQALGRSLTQGNGGILIAAGIFTAIYLLLRRLLRGVADQALLPPARLRRLSTELRRATLEPEQVAEFVLALADRHLGSDEGWLFAAEAGIGGQLILRPLLCRGPHTPDTAVFAADSPFATHLREEERPLIYHDVGALSQFDRLPPGERAVLTYWAREAFLPLRHDLELVGVLALGARRDGMNYRAHHLGHMSQLSDKLAGPLREALQLTAVRRIAAATLDDSIALLREKQILQQANGLQSQLIALISPDLRRPLDDIDAAWHELETRLATVEVSAEEPEPVPAGTRRRKSRRPPPLAPEERLSTAVQELRALLDHLIGLAGRIDTLGPWQWESLYLDDLCRKTIAGLMPMAEARQVTIEFSSRSRLSPVVGDAGHLMEAIRHLLHNAIKFSKIGGEVKVHCLESGADVCLEVSDDGVGIPEERLEAIWLGFERLASRTASGAGGLGLGLPLARAIVLAHGGRIALTSKHGAGATFTVHLPLNLDA